MSRIRSSDSGQSKFHWTGGARLGVGRFARFSAVGAVGTTVHYATLVLLVESGALVPVAASAFGFVVGALVNYALNRRITFRSTRPHGEALTRFMAIAVVGAFANTAIMKFGITFLAIHYLLAQVIATGAVVMLTFLGNSLWTFREPSHER